MKLTVRDAAKLLDTTEADIYRWISAGTIPCQRIGDHYRFHRTELLEWATDQGLLVSVEAFPPSRKSEAARGPFTAALARGGIHRDVGGSDREQVLRHVVDCIPLPDEGDRELLLDVMLAREALGSTGIGGGIAIPHARSPVVMPDAEASITLCFLDRPIDFDAVDGEAVHTVFSLVTHTPRSHLHLLSRLSAALHDPAFRQAIADRAPDEVIFAEADRVDRAREAKGEKK